MGLANPGNITTIKVLLISLTVSMAFSTACRFILMQMVIDKETKMRETLKIMSMKTSAYGLSYFLSQLIFTVLITVLLSFTFTYVGFIESGVIL